MALFVSAAYAFCRGGRPERVTAAAFCATFLLNAATYRAAWHRFHAAPFLLDLLLLALLFTVALRSDRWWPLAAVAFQLVAVAARLAPLVDPWTRSLAAYVGVVGWDYLTLTSLAFGTALECGRRPLPISDVARAVLRVAERLE